MFESINWLAAFVASAAVIVLGMGWYGVLSAQWMRASGLDPNSESDKARMRASSRPAMLTMLVGDFIMAAVMSIVVAKFAGSASEAVGTGVLMWIGFLMPATVSNAMFGMKGKALIWIDGGFQFIAAIVMSLIVYWWM